MAYLSLWEILREYGDIIEEIEYNEGELSPELEERLAINRDDAKERISKYRSVIDAFESEEGRLKTMAQGLLAKAKAYSKGAERLQKLVDIAVRNLGQKKETTTGFSYFIQLDDGKATAINYPKLEIENEEQVPENLKEFSVIVKGNKNSQDIFINYLKSLEGAIDVEFSYNTDSKVKNSELKAILKNLPLKGTDYAKLVDDYKVRFT